MGRFGGCFGGNGSGMIIVIIIIILFFCFENDTGTC
ncbi:hypothetical protein SRRS_53670 [Sporomusa rhizae]